MMEGQGNNETSHTESHKADFSENESKHRSEQSSQATGSTDASNQGDTVELHPEKDFKLDSNTSSPQVMVKIPLCKEHKIIKNCTKRSAKSLKN